MDGVYAGVVVVDINYVGIFISSYILSGVFIGALRDRMISGFWWAVITSPKYRVMIKISL